MRSILMRALDIPENDVSEMTIEEMDRELEIAEKAGIFKKKPPGPDRSLREMMEDTEQVADEAKNLSLIHI